MPADLIGLTSLWPGDHPDQGVPFPCRGRLRHIAIGPPPKQDNGHPRPPRRDALTVLPADVSADPEYRARFNREADLAATLWHPHIVSVHDRGEYNGQLWISMAYVDGLDAARRPSAVNGTNPRDAFSTSVSSCLVLVSIHANAITRASCVPPKAPHRLHYCQALHNFLARPNESRRSRVYADMAGDQYLIETPTTTERTQP